MAVPANNAAQSDPKYSRTDIHRLLEMLLSDNECQFHRIADNVVQLLRTVPNVMKESSAVRTRRNRKVPFGKAVQPSYFGNRC
jgi:hypothetical protein